jgi:hypothetical protein
MTDNLYAEYGNTVHRFPRTTKEAFGSDEPVFLANEYEEVEDITNFSGHFIMIVYTLAAIVVLVLWWRP